MAGMPSADVPAPVTSPSGDSGDPRVADVRARLDAAYQASATAPEKAAAKLAQQGKLYVRDRIALLLDETAQPVVEAGHLRFLAMLVEVLRAGGHTAPEPAARSVADLLEGTLVHTVSVRSRRVDVAELAAAVERLLH